MGYSSLISTADALALMPAEQRMEIIQSITDSSWAMRHCRRLRNLTKAQTTLKVSSELALAGWVDSPSGENHGGLIESTTTGWEDVIMYVGKLASYVVLDQDTIDDTDIDIQQKAKDQVSADMSKLFDAAVLYGGLGCPATWPTGGVYQHAVDAGNSVAIGTGADIYDDIIGMTDDTTTGVWGKVEADGFDPSAAVGAISMKSQLRGCRSTDGVPIFQRVPGQASTYELEGVPCEFPKHGGFPTTTSNLIVGDFTNAVWAMRKELEMKVLTEGVVNDAAGNIIVNLSQEDCVALRFIMRIGFALPNPINQTQKTKASRSPFGVLTV
jgi:HK97 family phage major capsid protein